MLGKHRSRDSRVRRGFLRRANLAERPIVEIFWRIQGGVRGFAKNRPAPETGKLRERSFGAESEFRSQILASSFAAKKLR
jgi:hypothetical protein